MAKFVDRDSTLERVKALGIDYAQGFVLHRPEPVEDGIFDGLDGGDRSMAATADIRPSRSATARSHTFFENPA